MTDSSMPPKITSGHMLRSTDPQTQTDRGHLQVCQGHLYMYIHLTNKRLSIDICFK